MAALARLLIIGFIVCTILYVVLSLYSRSVRKGKLREWWEEEGRPGDLDTYIEKGLEEYDGSLRRKLILGVYVVPFSIVAAIIYFTNFH
jgi:Ca2+/Na+ antiporter